MHTLIYHLKRYFYYYPLIFKNWYSVLYQMKKGKKEIFVVLSNGTKGICSKDCIVALVSLQQDYSYNIKSKIEGNKIYFKEGKLFVGYAEVKNTLSFSEYLFLFMDDWIKKNNIWYNIKYGIKTLYASLAFLEIFDNEQYNVDVLGKEVVDVGANIGDSSIYFAYKGAKKVYAFEPLPSIYKIAVENIKLNSLEDRVSLFNAGVGSRDSTMKVPLEISIEESGGFRPSNSGDIEVPIYSLEKIVKEIVKEPYLLKMDCEGCETDIIMNSKDEVLSKFEKIVFEHHRFMTKVKVKNLITKIESLGYKCGLKPAQRKYSKSDLGIVYCERN